MLVHEAQHGLENVRQVSARVPKSGDETVMRTVPLDVWTALKRSAHVNLASGVKDLKPITLLKQAESWSVYGNTTLSLANKELILRCYSNDTDNQHLTTTLCQLIEQRCLSDDYDHALSMLMEAKKTFVTHEENVWHKTCSRVLHEFQLWRGSLKDSEAMCSNLYSVSPLPNDSSNQLDAQFRMIRCWTQGKQLQKASEGLNSLISMCHRRGNHMQCVPYLLLQSQIHLMAGSVVSGLSCVLQCLALCQAFNIDGIRAAATIVLAQMQLGLGYPAKARDLIYSILPQVLANSPLYLLSLTHQTLSRCYLATSTWKQGDEKVDDLQSALHCLMQAMFGYQKLGCVQELSEVYYVQARLYNELNMVPQRNMAASNYKQTVESMNRQQYSSTHRLFYYYQDGIIESELTHAMQLRDSQVPMVV
eukprot:GFYU01034882.1.p1 GENE.GFYU01034882.1~~GFYU01034882.1.p1  ORF type:complete len:420 (-),score=129.61 GFYU01034882.1:283-1542(-)